ncbi:hypothetical protein Lal_00028301 [Lupinus albus]|nr:hypothetical protein Lal_00028301 [Lupinus albus]
MELGQPYSTSTNRRPGGRSTTLRNQQHERKLCKTKISFLAGSELTKEWLGQQTSISCTVEVTNSKKLSGVEDKEIVGVTLSYPEEPYEMKILRTVLERRFFELNDDRNGCRLNRKEIMQKLYRIIMRLCDWKLIPMIEALSTQVTENIRKLWNIILGHSNETPSYPKLLIIWP